MSDGNVVSGSVGELFNWIWVDIVFSIHLRAMLLLGISISIFADCHHIYAYIRQARRSQDGRTYLFVYFEILFPIYGYSREFRYSSSKLASGTRTAHCRQNTEGPGVQVFDDIHDAL